jgi:phospholipid/cholesterol/gamma-HCH transport system permease protein
VKRSIGFTRPGDDTLLVQLAGAWSITEELASIAELEAALEEAPQIRRVAFDTQELTAWDSSLLTFLIQLTDACARDGIATEQQGLPQGVRRLLTLATAVPEKKDGGRGAARAPLLDRIGNAALEFGRSAAEMLGFIGAAFLAFLKLLRGQARFRRCDLVLLIQECGAEALPIVSLISVLVGLILAFVGAIQLRMFGAQIYVADLVGLGMAREMGAMMTAIIMAGRTGAAFAAQLGTMQVNEEIDAFVTLGISPMEFLVLPRMLALVLMLPLLCLYADFMGILGGGLVGVGMLDLSPMEYFHQTCGAVQLRDFAAGVFKSAVFGVLVALAGCLRGLQCGRSSSAVGLAATSAVVTAIVWIVVSDATLTVIYDLLGI